MISLQYLDKKYGIKTVGSKLTKNKKDALDYVKITGFPVALKIESPDILHKTDIGGVKLNLNTEAEVSKAYEDIMDSVKANSPDAKIEGILVQEMLKEGLELIVGFENDKIFGPTIMVGMGGIFTEAFKDITFRLLPVTSGDIKEMLTSLKFSDILLKGYRNIAPISIDVAVEAIEKICHMATDMGDDISSFDINPITFWGDDYRVVDFKYISSRAGDKSGEQLINTKNLDSYFNAKSIAVIGATNKKDRIGYVVFDNLLNHGYKGKLYPVNRKYKQIEGIKVYPSILDIDEIIDLVVITVPLTVIPQILDQCRQKNIKSVIIISAGGKEIGQPKIEQDIQDRAHKYDIRIIGCNCLGIFDGKKRIDTLFQPYDNMLRTPGGSISLISQSGTVGISSLELLNNYGVSKFISYGNRIDVDEGDLLSYLSTDDSTKVIAVYIEGLEKGAKFYRAAKDTIQKKPVVVYKAGRSPQASKAALSHTGFLTGTHSLIEGVMDQAGIIQVDSLESLLASAKTLSIYERINRNRALIITNGAGTTIQAIDRIDAKGKISLAKLENKTTGALKEELPGHVIIANPIDLTGTATDIQYEMVIRAAVYDKNVDIIMTWFVFQCKPVTEKIVSILAKYSKLKPIVCGAIGLGHTYRIGRLIEKEKVPIFYSVEEWVSASEALYNGKKYEPYN